jgi:transaldolase/glucose-6-phosphate isomerase
MARCSRTRETYTSGHYHYDRRVSDPNLTVKARIPASLTAHVQQSLDLAAEQRVEQRLRDGDATLWAPPGTPEVANRLGWLTIHERMLAEMGPIELFAAEAHDDDLHDVVLLGMGGSSLAPEVLRRAFGHRADGPQLHVLDSTDAAMIREVERAVDLKRTLFIVSSKSGGTIEPLSLFKYFLSIVNDSRQFAAITDPGSGLEKLAAEYGFRHVFAGDPNIGGRYSALSAFGIVPAALMGVDVRALLDGAPAAWQTAISTATGPQAPPEPAQQTAAVWLGAALSALARAGRDKLTFVISESLPGLGLWLEQLVAESTGKHGTGILPVAEEPLGDPTVYGNDRVFAHLPDLDAPNPTVDAHVSALAQAGHPVISIPTRGPRDLGRVFLLAELAVAVAGWGLQINPYDQPNVQQAKDATKRVLDDYEANHALPQVTDAQETALRALLLDGVGERRAARGARRRPGRGPVAPPDYVAIMAYLRPSPEFDEAAGELRATIRQRTKATTTFGYGPRFLHSTGQFHKGGPKTGRFLQLIHDGPDDVEIPGAPYTFTTLKNAQAIGDLNTLRAVGLPAERVHLQGNDPVSALRALTATLQEGRPEGEHANR